ncbi:E3 ubiquitin-protein ligase At3g02290-like [Silene latifolia]|uniref:E3 ubiquitin-protein ligase At3g02290-like n=1 Tax=Silene latifolia TaxID=37657 RepID=UPI003D789B7B
MGSICSCLHVDDDLEDNVCSNCVCLNCFFHMFSSLCREEEVDEGSHPSSNPVSTDDNSLLDVYRSPPRPLPYDADPRYHRLQRDGLLLSSAKAATVVMDYFYSSYEDEDVCPTCLEDYTEENPKIVTKCSHHFHLGCIYEWMERSENCPVCGKTMAFDESH